MAEKFKQIPVPLQKQILIRLAGSGLGLAIAKEIIDNMHEKLWIDSKEGQGTEASFTITLKRSAS